jgi:GNAT superfamily N-acetyltransferase
MASPARIRPATAGDAEALAELATQLGYPTPPAEIVARLGTIGPGAAVLVACDGANRAVAWGHVELRQTLVEPLSAQVMGLVVADGNRSAGIGRQLLAALEAWAMAHGCRRMLVGTRVTRDRAHRFYGREGYEVLKTSYFLLKPLAPGPDPERS